MNTRDAFDACNLDFRRMQRMLSRFKREARISEDAAFVAMKGSSEAAACHAWAEHARAMQAACEFEALVWEFRAGERDAESAFAAVAEYA